MFCAADPAKIVSVPAIDYILETYTARLEHGLSSIAAIAVNAEGEIVYGGAFGRQSLDPSEDGSMRLDTVGWIGIRLHYQSYMLKPIQYLTHASSSLASCTKLMTAIAVMQCVERGQIGLDDDVGKVCPDLADPEVIDGFNEPDGSPIMRKASKPLTLRNLLSVDTDR